MKHSENYHVQYHHTDRDFNLKLLYLAQYMQETAVAAFDRLTLPRREIIEKSLAFVLSSISFKFEREIKKFDEICVETWALPLTSATFTRNYKVYNEATGDCCIIASSSWVLIHTQKRTLVNPKTLSESYTAATEDEEVGFRAVRKLRMPDGLETPGGENFLFDKEILYCDIDENMHMNNTVYLDIVQNALWKVMRNPQPGQPGQAGQQGQPGKLGSLDLSYNSGASEGKKLSVWGMKTTTETGAEVYIRGKAGEDNCFDARAVYTKAEYT